MASAVTAARVAPGDDQQARRLGLQRRTGVAASAGGRFPGDQGAPDGGQPMGQEGVRVCLVIRSALSPGLAASQRKTAAARLASAADP